MDGTFIEHLVDDVNDLLKQLCLPLVIETPYDLTPSFLLAILESILRDRLPIPSEIRTSTAQKSKIEMMKILLGVLEDDILEKDIGLSEIDPKRLAAGELDELIFVGQVLCQLGYEKLTLPRPSDNEDRNKAEEEARAAIRPLSRANTSSNTVDSSYEESETAPTSISNGSVTPTAHQPSPSPPSTPKCTHQLEFPEFFFNGGIRDDSGENKKEVTQSLFSYSLESHSISGATQSGAGVRHEGLLKRVSELEEIREFESRQGRFSKPSSPPSPPKPPKIYNSDKYLYPTQYTLALLRERAELLEELARLKLIRASRSIHS